MNNILVYGSGETKVVFFQRAWEVGIILNKKKLKLRLISVKYLGQKLTSEGFCPDPDKVEAVVEMPRPKNLKNGQRLIGLVTCMSKYLPLFIWTCEPLRRFTVKNTL